MSTKIEWCDLTINPVVGCSKCSPGCDNCYAERFAARLAKNPATAEKYAGVVDNNGKWTGELNWLGMSCFDKLPKKPKRVFVGSMTDMFHPNLNDDDGQGMLAMMSVFKMYPQHTFIMLTKRAMHMQTVARWIEAQDGPLPDNLWLNVTVCNQDEADEKIPLLLQTPAAKRGISVEPMLGAVDLWKYLIRYKCAICDFETIAKVDGFKCPDCGEEAIGSHHFYPALDWVICGGETGHHARPMHPEWPRQLRDQCQAAGVPFFFKGWGEWIKAEYDDLSDWKKRDDGGRGLFTNLDPVRGQFCDAHAAWRPDGQGGIEKVYGTDLMRRVGKKLAGRLLDGREWNEVPE